jgi:predicted RecB family nuclease
VRDYSQTEYVKNALVVGDGDGVRKQGERTSIEYRLVDAKTAALQTSRRAITTAAVARKMRTMSVINWVTESLNVLIIT